MLRNFKTPSLCHSRSNPYWFYIDYPNFVFYFFYLSGMKRGIFLELAKVYLMSDKRIVFYVYLYKNKNIFSTFIPRVIFGFILPLKRCQDYNFLLTTNENTRGYYCIQHWKINPTWPSGGPFFNIHPVHEFCYLYKL